MGKRIVVHALTISRLVAGVALVVVSSQYLWVVAALLLFYGFLSDMADGALARAWNVESADGAKLDSFIDAAFTFLALLGMLTAGVWPLWGMVLPLMAYVASLMTEPHLRGKWLVVLVLAHPLVNIGLLAAILVTLLTHATNGDPAVVGTLVFIGTLLVAAAKHARVHSYIQAAKARGLAA